MTQLRLENIHAGYKGTDVLRGISLTLWSPVVDSEWWSSNLCDPKRRWREVEEEALSLDLGRHHPRQPIPTFVAVTFLGVIGGRYRCRPAIDADVEAKHATESNY